MKFNIVPNFLFNKQIFFDFKKFLKLSKKNKIKFLFINNTDFKNLNFFKNNLYGNNLFLLKNCFISNKDLIDYKNEYDLDIFLKNNFNFVDLNLPNISYFLNFNMFLLNIIDIYKILILLNINTILNK